MVVPSDDAFREGVFQLALDEPAERAGAEHRVEPFFAEPLLGSLGHFQAQALFQHRFAHVVEHQVNDADDVLLREPVEDDLTVDAVQELGAEEALDLVLHLGLHLLVGVLLHLGLVDHGKPRRCRA